jgi:MFS family permease
MLGVIGQFTGILGTMYYEKSLKDFEVRTMIYWSTVISIISGFASYAFANRWNLDMHISDIVFIVFTDTIFGVISQAMNLLPTLALFAKITPTKIEGTVFAFLTGTTNLASTVISPLVGVWINEHYVGVTADNLSSYKTLCLISMLTSFLGFLIIPLIPMKEHIKAY